MWGAGVADVDDQARIRRHQRPGGAGMVEVDVREQQMAKVADAHAVVGEPALEHVQA